ncbi:hypothetical protein FSP39_012377, partial [Pinctada imbricata]
LYSFLQSIYPISRNNTKRSKISPKGNLQRNTISRSRTHEIDEEAEAELLFLTDISRPTTTASPTRSEEIEDPLETAPKELLSPPDVRAEIYRRESSRLSVVPVSSYLKKPTRNSLAIRNSAIGPRGAMALSAPLMLDCNMTHLDLAGNSIGASGLDCLIESFHESMTVTHLNLSDNDLGTEGAKILCQAMMAKKCVFETLNLSGNNESLDTLNISWNHIRRKSAYAFMKGIKTNIGLKTLDISFNGLGSEGAKGLAVSLKKNRSLTELDLSHNRLLDEDVILIGKSLANNDGLKILKV